THRVLLVTITIGGDDVLGCILRDGSIINGCPEQGLAAIGHNLPYILSELRAAAGPNVPIVATNYFDPFLAAPLLLPGAQGQGPPPISLPHNPPLEAPPAEPG